MGLRVAATFLAVSLTAAVAVAAPQRVSVDWRLVPDRTVKRCELRGLGTLLLQGLIDEGLAVVSTEEEADVRFTWRIEGNAWVGTGVLDDDRESVRVPMAKHCDSSIELELQHATTQVALTLIDRQPETQAAPLPPPAAGLGAVGEPAPPEPPPAHFLTLGLGATYAGTDATMATLRARYTHVLTRSLEVSAGLEAALFTSDAITVLEPGAFAGLAWRLPLGAWRTSVGLEGAFVEHLFAAGSDRDGHPDVRLGLPVTLTQADWGTSLALLPYLRAREARHLDGEETTFYSRHVGLLATVNFTLAL